MNINLRSKILVTFLLSGLSILLLAVYGLQVYHYSENIDREWRDYNEKSVKISQALFSLKSAIGYGGFIHNFKNYVLRTDGGYIPFLRQDIARLNDQLDVLSRLYVNENENRALETVRKTFEEYIANIQIITRAIENGAEPVVIDRLVKVDDAPALASLEILGQSQLTRSTKKAQETRKALNKATSLILAGSIIFVVIIVISAIVIFILIKTQKLYEAQLSISEENELLFQHSPDATIEVNQNGIIQRANQQAEELFEYSQDELVGMSVEELMPQDVRTHHAKLREGYFDKPVFRPMAKSTIIRSETKSKKQPILQISLSHFNKAGEAVTIASIRDVSEIYASQQRIEKANQLAQQAMKAKNAVLANMSHELRTPLNHVLGFSELLLSDASLSAKQKERLEYINKSGQHHLALIDHILELGELSDLSDVEMSDFNMSGFLQEVTNQFKVDYDQVDLSISYKVDSRLPDKISGTPQLLEKVLHELLSNACKFNDKDQVLVEISASCRDKHFEISVQDNGPGIDPIDFDKAFAPFERLDAMERAIDGVGFGLATSKQIIESLDGKIWFNDTDKGCKISIRLPLM